MGWTTGSIRTSTTGPVGCSTRSIRTSPVGPEVDVRLLICRGEELVCLRGDENHQTTSRKQNISDLTTRKICVPLVPVKYVNYIDGLSET